MRSAIVAILCLLFLALPANAEEDFVPNELRIVTKTTATSSCIGDPRSPACVPDTMFACVVRQDAKLCEIAGITQREPCFSDEIVEARYAIEDVEQVSVQDLLPYLRSLARPGESYAVIDAHSILCRTADAFHCDQFGTDAMYTVKSGGQSWLLTDFPAEADQCEDFTE
jgi:hypothetical protein